MEISESEDQYKSALYQVAAMGLGIASNAIAVENFQNLFFIKKGENFCHFFSHSSVMWPLMRMDEWSHLGIIAW